MIHWMFLKENRISLQKLHLYTTCFRHSSQISKFQKSFNGSFLITSTFIVLQYQKYQTLMFQVNKMMASSHITAYDNRILK